MPKRTKKQKLMDEIYDNGISNLLRLDYDDDEGEEVVRRHLYWDLIQVQNTKLQNQ